MSQIYGNYYAAIGDSLAISTDGISLLGVVYYESYNSNIVWLVLLPQGQVEYHANPNGGKFSKSLNSAYSIYNYLMLTSWTSGSSSPYNIRFVAMPLVIPTAADFIK